MLANQLVEYGIFPEEADNLDVVRLEQQPIAPVPQQRSQQSEITQVSFYKTTTTESSSTVESMVQGIRRELSDPNQIKKDILLWQLRGATINSYFCIKKWKVFLSYRILILQKNYCRNFKCTFYIFTSALIHFCYILIKRLKLSSFL